MVQLKFDKNGFILPQKISYEVKHEEETKEAIKIVELEKELLQGLKALGPEDRNIKALTIFCNSNYSKGSDQEIRTLITEILTKFVNKGIVIKEKSSKNRDIFSLIKLKNMRKK